VAHVAILSEKRIDKEIRLAKRRARCTAFYETLYSNKTRFLIPATITCHHLFFNPFPLDHFVRNVGAPGKAAFISTISISAHFPPQCLTIFP